MLSISWIPIGKKNLLGVSQFPGKNLNNFFDLTLFAKDLEIISKQKIKLIVSLLPDGNNMIDWSLTKYKGRKNYENYPLDHKVEYFVDNFISREIPGCVANKIYEFSYDKNKKAYRFIPNKNYSYLE